MRETWRAGFTCSHTWFVMICLMRRPPETISSSFCFLSAHQMSFLGVHTSVAERFRNLGARLAAGQALGFKNKLGPLLALQT